MEETEGEIKEGNVTVHLIRGFEMNVDERACCCCCCPSRTFKICQLYVTCAKEAMTMVVEFRWSELNPLVSGDDYLLKKKYCLDHEGFFLSCYYHFVT